jgi:hypothetical protein
MADNESHQVVKTMIVFLIHQFLSAAKQIGFSNDEILAGFRAGARIIEKFKESGTLDGRDQVIVDEELSYIKTGPKVG